jgi:alcohol dehydrogenase class IV
MFPAPHGAVCAALLPHAVETNIEALRARAPHSDALRRYDIIARLLTGQTHSTADDAVWWLTELCARLEIPPLRAYGVEEEHIPDLVAKAAKASSMKGNPIELTAEELTEIVSRAR